MKPGQKDAQTLKASTLGADDALTMALAELDAGLRQVGTSARAIAACRDRSELGRVVLDQFIANLPESGGVVYFLRDDALVRDVQSGMSDAPASIPLPLASASLLGKMLDERTTHSLDTAEAGTVGGDGWEGYAGCPLLGYPILDSRGEAAGFVILHARNRPAFTSHDREVGTFIASFASESLRAIESAESLRESESKLARLLSNLPGMAYRRLHDACWTMRFASAGCESLTGLEPAMIIDNKRVAYFDLIHPDDQRRVHAEVDAAVAQCGSFRINYRIFTAEGELKWVSEQGTPIFSDGGILRGIEGFVADITERKRAEDERSRLAMAIEQSVESVVIMDALGIIEYVNPAFEEHSGFRRHEVLGQDIRFLQRGQYDSSFFEEQWRAISQGEVWTGVITNRTKDGALRKEKTSISPVRDAMGNIVHFVATSKDITKEFELETHLRQAHKLEAIGELAAGVAHEINTPTQYIGDNIRFFQESFADLQRLLQAYAELAAAARNAGLLREQTRHVAEVEALVDLEYLLEEVPVAIAQSLEGNQRVAEIVRAMKEFAHPGSDEKTGIDINRAIKSTVSVARNEWRYVSEVSLDLDPGLALVPGHASSFNQVILNLIVNAAHAIADAVGVNPARKGTIGISTRRLDDWAEIRVSDTGTGIPDAIRGRIFDPFFTTKQAGKGTGHGLAVAHSVIVEKHGGTIEVDSALGKGTTFVLRLPMHREDAR